MRVVVLLLCVLARVASAEPGVLDEYVETVTGYRNGKPIKLQVIFVDGIEIEVTTAKAYVQMRDAAAADDVTFELWSGFRSNERQAELYEDFKSGGVIAAKPGYSNHQSGRALDIAVSYEGDATFEWLQKNAARFRFRRTVPSEPWHWEFSPPPPKAKPKAKAKPKKR